MDGGFTKQGSGTLIIQWPIPNTYTGATTIEAGTLQLSGGGLAEINVGYRALILDISDVIGSISGAGAIQLASGVTFEC